MGFLDGDFFGGTSSTYSSNPRHRSRSGTRSTSGRSGHYSRPAASRSSSYHGNGSSRGFFSSTGSGGSSHYKRRPRDGYISYLVHRLQRLLRDLWQYFRKHPVKAFFAVIVPLISAGGAVGGLLKGMGFRIPPGISSVLGGGGGSTRGGGGYYGSQGYGGGSGFGSSFGGLGGLSSLLGGGGGGGGMMGNAGTALKIARMFM
ncbi:hypothetical protein Q7P37_002956 [Cladosporium fusiforme]